MKKFTPRTQSPPRDACRFPAQAAEIEGIARRTGLDDKQLAERLPGVDHKTIYKARQGYQKASDLIMHSLRAIERVQNVFSVVGTDHSEKLASKIEDEINFVLRHGRPEEVKLLESIVASAYHQVRDRKHKSSRGNPK